MKRSALVLLVLLAVPTFAAIAPDVTLPVAGRVVLPGHTYLTELTITNHRDVIQNVAIQFIGSPVRGLITYQLEPNKTKFFSAEQVTGLLGLPVDGQGIGAVRFTSVTRNAFYDDDNDVQKYFDSKGMIEVHAHIINERGPFGLYGSSRQEVDGVPYTEYTATENTFVGVLHQPPTYTNVGVTNLSDTETVTFFVQYQYLEPVAVTVAPQSSVQIRIRGGANGEEGNAGRYVVVTPEWATDGSGRTTPWVAYTSTIDGYTGDAFSGVRVPPDTTIRR